MSVRHHYAVAVLNDDMRPRMFQGESVIFDKDQVPRPDRDVFISLRTGGYLLRELVSMDEGGVTVHTYAPDSTAVIPLDAIAGMYPIIQRCFCSLGDLLGRTEDIEQRKSMRDEIRRGESSHV